MLTTKNYTAIFNDPQYWNGDKGYRIDPRNGVGYQDWDINSIRANYVASKKPQTVLDLGCAMGYVVQRLRSQGISAFGVDVSDYIIDRVPQERKAYVRKMDITAGLPWPDKYLDMVVSFSALEHIDPSKIGFVISEIIRVSRRGIIAVTLGDSPQFDEDASHTIKQPLSWWRSQFPAEYEVVTDADEYWLSIAPTTEVTASNASIPTPVQSDNNRKVLASHRSTMRISGGVPSAQAKALNIALVAPPFIPVPPPGYGGSEVVMYDLACGLRDRGHRVTVFAADESPRDRGYEMVGFGPALLNVQCDWQQAEKSAYMKIRDRLINGGFDIIHTHDWFGFAYEARRSNPNLRVCHTHHGHIDARWWKSSTPGFPINLFAISEFMKAEYAGMGFSARRVYNGIDLGKYLYQEKKGDRLLFVGRASALKQPHVAIDIAKKLNMGLDLVCGKFVDDANYLNQIKAACDGTQIRYIEEPPQDEKVRLMQNAKCLIAPSNMGEPFGLMNVESLSCGTPCICTPDGAIPEVVEHSKTGFICTTLEEMIEAVKSIGDIKPSDCRARAEQFSREIMATAYEREYRDMLTGKEW